MNGMLSAKGPAERLSSPTPLLLYYNIPHSRALIAVSACLFRRKEKHSSVSHFFSYRCQRPFSSVSLCVQLKVVWVTSKKVTVFVAKRACNGIKQFRIACQMFREVPLALKVFMGLKLQLNIFNAPYSFMYSNSFDNF